MLGAGDEHQLAMGRDSTVERAGLLGACPAVGRTGEDQDGHIIGDAGDRLEGGDFVEVGQEDRRDKFSPV